MAVITIGIRRAISARNGGRSTRSSTARDIPSRTGAASVLTRAAPSPGKCLAVAAIPADPSPPAKATAARDTTAGEEPKIRPSRARADPGRATSATGARSTFAPTERSSRPAAAPAARAAAGPACPSADARRAGGPGSRRTSPPSWSTITSSGTSRAAGRGIA